MSALDLKDGHRLALEVVYSTEALRDLDAIWDWIATEHEEPSAAEHVVNGILDRIDELAEFPFLAPSLDSRCAIRSDWRFVEKHGYLAFYRVSGSRVFVDRILSGKSDYARKLFGVDDGVDFCRKA